MCNPDQLAINEVLKQNEGLQVMVEDDVTNFMRVSVSTELLRGMRRTRSSYLCLSLDDVVCRMTEISGFH